MALTLEAWRRLPRDGKEFIAEGAHGFVIARYEENGRGLRATKQFVFKDGNGNEWWETDSPSMSSIARHTGVTFP